MFAPWSFLAAFLVIGRLGGLLALEADVIVVGATMIPGFIRKSGHKAARCPESHPWPLHQGALCCAHSHRVSDPALPLAATDDPTECSDTLSCSNPSRGCIPPKPKQVINLYCPLDHPFMANEGQFCCSSPLKRMAPGENPLCDGSRLDASDPKECCDEAVPCSVSQQVCSKGSREILYLLLRHDISATSQMFTNDNYRDVNRNDASAAIFSRFDELELFRDPVEGNFHMKLCYPNLNDADDGDPCYEFKQSQHPEEASNRDEDTEGLVILRKPYSNEHPTIRFAGLRQDSTGNAMLDGQKGGNWNYVAASKVLFLGTSLPGPVVDEGGKVQKLTDLVELFVVLVA